ncbi:hypothetical protein [Streptomyces sp. NPDC001450]
MSENPQVTPILEHIETRERELAYQAGQLRERIEELTRQLGEIDAEREPAHHPQDPPHAPAAEPDRPDIPAHPAYQQILTTLADEGRPMPARDLCQALDLPILPKNTEGIRSKLKRLVNRGILVEPEPGLFARPGA